MIYGIGSDISKVSRFEKWVKNPQMLLRFFNPCEIIKTTAGGQSLSGTSERNMHFLCEHYAARFSAKEAFAKALGTGFAGLSLCDFGIVNNGDGKPDFVFGEKTKKIIDSRCGPDWNVKVSVSHEKEYAVAFTVIEVN